MASESFCASSRATMLVPLPGAKPTMMRTGLVGQVCACADPRQKASSTTMAANANSLRVIMLLSPVFFKPVKPYSRAGLSTSCRPALSGTHCANRSARSASAGIFSRARARARARALACGQSVPQTTRSGARASIALAKGTISSYAGKLSEMKCGPISLAHQFSRAKSRSTA